MSGSPAYESSREPEYRAECLECSAGEVSEALLLVKRWAIKHLSDQHSVERRDFDGVEVTIVKILGDVR